MKYRLGLVLGVVVMGLVLIATASASEGLITIKSKYDVETTMDKLQSKIENAGMTIFKRVDHTAGAERVGLSLRPTLLLIFGNPKVGTPLMNCSQALAIDLPQKALVWADAQGDVWLSYNDPAYLKRRHKTDGCDAVFEKVTKVLDKFASMATSDD